MDSKLPARGLIIRAPWAELVARGQKKWEMRSKPTQMRGTVAIIEGGTGLIIGQADLVGGPSNLNPLRLSEAYLHRDKHLIDNLELLSKWRYPWVFANAQLYPKAIPYAHPHGAVIWVDLTKPGVIL